MSPSSSRQRKVMHSEQRQVLCGRRNSPLFLAQHCEADESQGFTLRWSFGDRRRLRRLSRRRRLDAASGAPGSDDFFPPCQRSSRVCWCGRWRRRRVCVGERAAMAGQGASEPALFTELEVEFMAEDESINIVPNVRMDTLHMICGDYGPFRPQIPVTVPLWLGVAMKKRSKCRIQPPDWMSVERLTEVLEMEREAPREFQPLPFHYVEIAKLLLDNAREDFENNYMVQSLLEDIKDVRWDKVEKGLKNLSRRTHAVKLKNISAMEVNRMRSFTVRALQSFFKHDNDDMMKETPTESGSQSTLTSLDRLPRRTLRPR